MTTNLGQGYEAGNTPHNWLKHHLMTTNLGQAYEAGYTPTAGLTNLIDNQPGASLRGWLYPLIPGLSILY